MIPHIHTLFEFISISYENQHQTLNIKKIDRGQIKFREYSITLLQPWELTYGQTVYIAEISSKHAHMTLVKAVKQRAKQYKKLLFEIKQKVCKSFYKCTYFREENVLVRTNGWRPWGHISLDADQNGKHVQSVPMEGAMADGPARQLQ